MMLWPKRMVVPILPEEVTGPLDDLYLRRVPPCFAQPNSQQWSLPSGVLCDGRRVSEAAACGHACLHRGL